MRDTKTATSRRVRSIERYAYVERDYDDVWPWLAGHLSAIGDPLEDGGRSVELRVAPGGMHLSRPVRLRVSGMVCGDRVARAALGWADVDHPRVFPRLDAVLEVRRVTHDGAPFTQLGFLARYRPPLGPLGAIGDRLLGAEIVDASLTTFLDELAEAVADHVIAPSLAGENGRAGDRPAQSDPDTRRLLLMVQGLAIRPGGAAGACDTLRALPGVVHVSLDPWNGLAAVDHDPARCDLEQMTAALDERLPAEPVA